MRYNGFWPVLSEAATMRRTLILLASLGIIILGVWGSGAILLNEDRLKSVFADRVAEQTGRRLEIHGALRLKFFPRLRLEAEDVVLSGPQDFEGPELLQARNLSLSMRLLPLIRGNLSAGELQLSRATLNIHTDAGGRSTLDGLMGAIRRQADRPDSGLLATRQMRLEDVRLVVSDIGTERPESLEIDRIELDRFRLDAPLEFRFVGNVGDPSIFETLEIQGQLHIPSATGQPMHLTNMRLDGALRGSEQALSMVGQLSFSPSPPLSLLLEDGRVGIDDQQFALTASYHGADRGRLGLEIAGERLHWPPVSGRSALADQDWLPYLRGMDFDVATAFDQADVHELALESVRARITGRDGRVRLDQLEAFLPGADLSGDGHFDMRYRRPKGELSLSLDIAQAGDLLQAVGVPAVLSGAGTAKVRIGLAHDDKGWARSAFDGQMELWDGGWRLEEGTEPAVFHFNQFSGTFRVMESYVDVTDLALRSDERELIGWAAVNLDDGSLGGRVSLVDSGREIELSGSLDAVRSSHPLLVGHSGGGEPDEVRPVH